MEEQLSIFNGDITPVPKMWDCTKTCKRFGEHVDYPSWWFGEGRCLLPKNEHFKEVYFDNGCYFYCALYEKKDNS